MAGRSAPAGRSAAAERSAAAGKSAAAGEERGSREECDSRQKCGCREECDSRDEDATPGGARQQGRGRHTGARVAAGRGRRRAHMFRTSARVATSARVQNLGAGGGTLTFRTRYSRAHTLQPARGFRTWVPEEAPLRFALVIRERTRWNECARDGTSAVASTSAAAGRSAPAGDGCHRGSDRNTCGRQDSCERAQPTREDATRGPAQGPRAAGRQRPRKRRTPAASRPTGVRAVLLLQPLARSAYWQLSHCRRSMGSTGTA